MKQFVADYEYAKSTQRFIMLVHRTEAIRRSPCPYVYISKELYAELGGAIPREGEALTILTITIGGPE